LTTAQTARWIAPTTTLAAAGVGVVLFVVVRLSPRRAALLFATMMGE